MRIATLFSGIGAPEQAGLRLGYESVFACEWDKYARQSFLANYDLDEEHFHKDVYDLDATVYRGKVDILIGGSPCQAFSIAGLRKGLNDKRGELIYEYIRVVDEVRSPYIVYENVKGMMSVDKGRTIKEFVQALRDIGYHCHYSVINSKDYGIPQNRERLFLVGFLDVEQYHAFSFAPKVKLVKRLKDVLESEVDEKYYLSQKMIDSFHNTTFNQAKDRLQTKDISDTILARDYKDPKLVNVVGMLNINANEQCKRVYGVYGVYGVSPTLSTMQGGYREPKIFEDITDGVRFFKDGCCGALRTSSECGDKRVLEPCKHLTDDYRIRKLTPRECLRLQDFPDTFKQVVSDSQLYKQAGNSMTVAVLEMIFRQIEKARSKEMGGLFGSVA